MVSGEVGGVPAGPLQVGPGALHQGGGLLYFTPLQVRGGLKEIHMNNKREMIC